MTDESRWPLDRKEPFPEESTSEESRTVESDAAQSAAELPDEAYSQESPHEQKSTIGERLTGVRDPKDPDGLLTVDDARDLPDPSAFGSAPDRRPDLA